MDEEKLKTMGARIREAREALGLKHSDIARELGVSESHVRYFETGQALPAYLLDWLIDQEINLNWVFRGIGDMFLTSDSHKIVLIEPQFEEDVQRMLKDFGKFPELKHYILSEYFTFLEFLLIQERKRR